MASHTIQWKYDYMYSWYNKYRDYPTEDLQCIVYHAQRPRGKGKAKLELEKFIRPNITFVGLCPVQYDEYENGLYTVLDDNKSNKKWMFFVYPSVKDGILFADHHSFCFDSSDKKHPVHYHTTVYKKERIENTQMHEYTNRKYDDYMPANINIPRTGDVADILNKTPYKDVVLNLIREPWWDTQSTGGAKKTEPRKEYVPNRPIISPNFDALWTTHEYKSMFAFGFKKGRSIHWTVSFHRKGRRPRGRVEVAYAFSLPLNHDEAVFQNTLASLAA